MPGKATELATHLGLEAVPRLDQARTLPLSELLIRKASPLFPRIELEK